MAKRKNKKAKTKRSSGRRMRGAAEMDGLYAFLGALIGGFGTYWGNTKVAFLQGKIGGVLETALGGVMVWKIKNPFARGLGFGIGVAGSLQAGKSFGILAGIGAPRNFQQRQGVNGFRNVPQVGGIGQVNQLPGNRFPSPNIVGRVNKHTYAGMYGN